MLSIRHALPGLYLLVNLASACAQETMAQPQPQPDQVAKAAEAVRNASAALQRACLAMPPHTYIPLPLAEANRIPNLAEAGNTPGPVGRPYATEEDICLMAKEPEKAFMPYFFLFGLFGGVLALIGLAFFAYIGGIIRSLWLAPMNQLGKFSPFRNSHD